MPRARWREPTDELAERLRELNTEQTQDGDDNEEDDAANELGIPMNLTRLCAIESAQDYITVYLNNNMDRDADEGEYDKPVVVREGTFRLQRVGTYREKH